ncbi:MAG: SAM-dependent methyltransferase [Actinobacteria bacterium]|nr:SAM-dependent methyltransferase [Actinomycetota bacterium]
MRDAGICQFPDIGSGLPSSPNVHELLDRILRLTSGRLAVTGWLAVGGRLAVTRCRCLQGGWLLPRPVRGTVAEEPDDHENRHDEHVEEDQVVPAPEEE